MSYTSQKQHILVVDDERTSLKTIESVLVRNRFSVDSYSNPKEALKAFRTGSYDLILSDYYMPEMNGDELLQEVRKLSVDCPFIFLTVDSNLKQAIELIQSGADDYIVKPIVPDDLVFRINRCLESICRRQKENNWRELYASKDIKQTEGMIDQLSQSINQAGGYLWIDLLKEELQNPVDGKYSVSTDIGDMVLETAQVQKQILEHISMIADTNRIQLNTELVSIHDLSTDIQNFCRKKIEEDLKDYNRKLSTGFPSVIPEASVQIDTQRFHQVLNEILVNAVKFSPEKSPVVVYLNILENQPHPQIEITIQNHACHTGLKDSNGQAVSGISADHTETVFDLFFSSQNFRDRMPGEEWAEGAGLYVARKLMKRHGGWIRAASGTDHTAEMPVQVVRFTLTLPLHRQNHQLD
ncbi:hybrid sensor histidine kinase/response regulator [Spirochaeta dissipatitropha]